MNNLKALQKYNQIKIASTVRFRANKLNTKQNITIITLQINIIHQ